jgi:hypothetical protein
VALGFNLIVIIFNGPKLRELATHIVDGTRQGLQALQYFKKYYEEVFMLKQ